MSTPNFQGLEHSFADMKFSYVQELHCIKSKIETQEYVISQLHQYLQKIIEKQSLSFANLRRTVLALCKELDCYCPHHHIIIEAKKILEDQCDRWNSFGSKVKNRINRVNGKNSQPPLNNNHKYSIVENQPIKFEQRGLFDSDPSFSPNLEDVELPQPARISIDYPKVKLEGGLTQTNRSIERDEDRPDYKIRMHEQFGKIREYVHLVLAPMLEYNEQKIISKKIILNNYLDWNRQNKREPLISSNAQIQMELTVQVKNAMPRVVSIRKILKGVTFKREFEDKLQFTDRAPPISEYHFSFEGEGCIDPLDLIIKEGSVKKTKAESIKPFSEEQNIKLNSYLGL